MRIRSVIPVMLGFAGLAAADGPDLLVADIPSARRWTTETIESAYSFGLRTCNAGDADACWRAAPSTCHPLKTQNLYRLSVDGRFEQIGLSWLAHVSCALQQTDGACGACGGGGGCLDVLHAGCASPNTSSMMGAQAGLSPRWQVNPHTGDFEIPWNEGEGTDGELRRRVRVRNDDLDPALNPGARYFAEILLVAADDAAAANQNDNASFREVTVSPASLDLTVIGVARRGEPALAAWAEADPGVTLTRVQLDADGVPDPETGRFDDGLFVIGARATDEGAGWWRYEYVVYNMNAHRAARAFTVPVPAALPLDGVAFRDVAHHSGDGIDGVNFDDTDWTPERGAGALTWSTATFAENENANALRWGTLYAFRFRTQAPPVEGAGRLDVFRPGVPSYAAFPTIVPAAGGCPADLDRDGSVAFGDLLAVLAAWGPCPPESCPEDLDGSGAVDVGDLLVVLAAWGPCPA